MRFEARVWLIIEQRCKKCDLYLILRHIYDNILHISANVATIKKDIPRQFNLKNKLQKSTRSGSIEGALSGVQLDAYLFSICDS